MNNKILLYTGLFLLLQGMTFCMSSSDQSYINSWKSIIPRMQNDIRWVKGQVGSAYGYGSGLRSEFNALQSKVGYLESRIRSLESSISRLESALSRR